MNIEQVKQRVSVLLLASGLASFGMGCGQRSEAERDNLKLDAAVRFAISPSPGVFIAPSDKSPEVVREAFEMVNGITIAESKRTTLNGESVVLLRTAGAITHENNGITKRGNTGEPAK